MTTHPTLQMRDPGLAIAWFCGNSLPQDQALSACGPCWAKHPLEGQESLWKQLGSGGYMSGAPVVAAALGSPAQPTPTVSF